MNPGFQLEPVARITAGAIGEPGARTFYLQATAGDRVLSLLVEKGQVAALARSVEALLDRLATTHPAESEGPEPSAVDLELTQPVEPEFRVGSMSLGYDAERDLILLECGELVAPDDEEDESTAEDVPPREGAVARFWASRPQMRTLARHAAAVVASGRPVCELCGLPIDADGHVCIALNGHRKDHDLS